MSLVDEYVPAEKSLWLLLDGTLERAIDETRRRLHIARSVAGDRDALDSPVPGLERQLADLQAQADAKRRRVVFRAIPRVRFEELKLAAPSPDPQLEFDVAVFAPALIAASCADPELTLQEATRIWTEWSSGVSEAMYLAAWEVNEAANLRPFSAADIAALDPLSEPNSTTAPPEGSPTPSS